jgi:hypothetical protein
MDPSKPEMPTVSAAQIKSDALSTAWFEDASSVLTLDNRVGLVIVDPPFGVLKNVPWDTTAWTAADFQVLLENLLRAEFMAPEFSVVIHTGHTLMREVWDALTNVGAFNIQVFYWNKDNHTRGSGPRFMSDYVQPMVVGFFDTKPASAEQGRGGMKQWPGWKMATGVDGAGEDSRSLLHPSHWFPYPPSTSKLGRSDIDQLQVSLLDGKTTANPSQKPVELARWIIRHFCVEGLSVLAPCAGTGTVQVSPCQFSCILLRTLPCKKN